MSLKNYIRKTKPIEVLNEEQIGQIHEGVLNVLENTGIRFEYEKALNIFNKNGCNVDFETNRVRFPGDIVEELLKKCPESYEVRSRNPEHNLKIGGDSLYFAPMPGMQILDLDTWESRTATIRENEEGIIVLDALDNLHILASYTPYFEIEGISPEMAIPESVANKMRNSTKVQWTGYQKDCEIFNIEMAKATEQEIIGICLPSSPLTYYSDACESGIRFANENLPVNLANAPIMGGTSPSTIAGSLVSYCAEAIGGIMLLQMVRPGTKVMVEGSALPMNMRSGSPIFNSISNSLFMVAFGQIWRKYKIPTLTDTGWTNSKKIDFQNGYERAINTIIVAQAGIDIIILHGGVYGELVHHPLQSVLDDDIAAMVGRFVEGIDITTEKLAVDLINEVGPIPGHFLNTAHTRKFYKEENYIPETADLLTYPEWKQKDSKDTIDIAKEKLDEILKNHRPIPLPEDQDKEISKILNKAREYYKERDK